MDRHVRNTLEHGALVGEPRPGVDHFAIDPQVYSPEEQDIESRCGDDDVGLNLLIRLQENPLRSELLDVVGDHLDLARERSP